MSSAITDHIPWIIYVYLSKAVTVIPFFYSIINTLLTLVVEHILDFRICKAKIFVKFNILD